MDSIKEEPARNLLDAIISSNAQDIKIEPGHFLFLVESIGRLKKVLERVFEKSGDDNEFNTKLFNEKEKIVIFYDLAVLIELGKVYGVWHREAWKFLIFLKINWRISDS